MGASWMVVENCAAFPLIVPKTLYAVYLFTALVTGVPIVTFPINSQVPPVVRVLVPFIFTFSASTFSGSSPLDYTLSSAPSWLFLNGSTRTLSGVAPEVAANTAPIVRITATDNTGSVTMNTTLVVSGNPAPSVLIPLEDQLPAMGTYSPPSSVLYYPSTTFNITFDSGTFSSSTLNHYAVTSDNTPLPAWVVFDGASLSFSGKTPDYYSLVQPPQSWGLQIIASDVLGFAGTAIKFNIVVGNHKLDFKEGFLIANAIVGTFFRFTSLSGNLYLDGNTVNMSDIVSADAKTPSWLAFSNSNFSFSGTPPAGATSFNISVIVLDIYGDTASTVVHIHIALPLFSETAGSVNATIGMPFSYSVSPLLSNSSGVAVSLRIEPSTPWLSFNSQTLTLNGSVPSYVQPSRIHITIEATSKFSNVSDSRILTIMVISILNPMTSSTTIASTIAVESTASTVSPTTTAPAKVFMVKVLSKGEIAAITVPIVLLSIAAVGMLFFYCKRKRHHLGKGEGSPNKSEISRPMPTLSQIEEETEVRDPVTGSDAYTTTTFSSRRRTLVLQRHSQAMSNLVGGVSMNLRDSRSTGTRGRAYSENALSDFGSSWRHTQESAYPPLRINSARRSSARNTRNFSRKTSAPISLTNRSSVDLLGSTISKRTSKASKSSIQQTPDFAYDSENTKERLSRRRTSGYMGIQGVGRRLSGIGHGLQHSTASYSTQEESPRSSGIGHGTRTKISGSQNNIFPREGSSWVTIGSTDLKEQHRRSVMSVLTESTEVLNSPKRKTLRQVPKSPGQEPTVRMSTSSKSSQPSSKRAVGSSPFFGGSSRTESRGTPRKSLWVKRDKHLYPGSPPGRSREELVDGLDKSIMLKLRSMEPGSSDPASNLPRDSLGITYGGPREGTRLLRDYVSQLGHRANLSLRNSPQFSDSDSRFKSAEHSPQWQDHKEARDQDGGLVHSRDGSPQPDMSPGSFNQDRYGLDESPELSQAIGVRAVIRSNLPKVATDPSTSEGQSILYEPVQEKYTQSPCSPASSDRQGIAREKCVKGNEYEIGPDDEADISVDGLCRAFL